jgi:hypothetical protein
METISGVISFYYRSTVFEDTDDQESIRQILRWRDRSFLSTELFKDRENIITVTKWDA